MGLNHTTLEKGQWERRTTEKGDPHLLSPYAMYIVYVIVWPVAGNRYRMTRTRKMAWTLGVVCSHILCGSYAGVFDRAKIREAKELQQLRQRTEGISDADLRKGEAKEEEPEEEERPKGLEEAFVGGQDTAEKVATQQEITM